MQTNDLATLGAALTRLREVNAMLDNIDAGVCIIHLDASIAALESRIAKLNAAPGQDLNAVAEAANALGRPIGRDRHSRC